MFYRQQKVGGISRSCEAPKTQSESLKVSMTEELALCLSLRQRLPAASVQTSDSPRLHCAAPGCCFWLLACNHFLFYVVVSLHPWKNVKCHVCVTNIHGICLVLTTMHVSQTDAMQIEMDGRKMLRRLICKRMLKPLKHMHWRTQTCLNINFVLV